MSRECALLIFLGEKGNPRHTNLNSANMHILTSKCLFLALKSRSILCYYKIEQLCREECKHALEEK